MARGYLIKIVLDDEKIKKLEEAGFGGQIIPQISMAKLFIWPILEF